MPGKHVYVTRFPVANYQNIYPARVKILTTSKTRKIYISFDNENYEYDENYFTLPSMGSKSECEFFDVTIIGNGIISSMGADYDGDTVFLRGVFTEEANNEAEKLIWKKTNLFSANGNISRTISGLSKDVVLGLFELSKDAL